MERVADYIIERLAQAGVNKLFLVTGRGILYLTDAVAKNPAVQGISLYHEQGISYAAMAYAAARDGMGACLVSTGCAATNAITAALCAWQDNLPCVFISGQHMLHETTRYTGIPIRTYGSQEADIISLVKPITKYAVMLMDPADTAVELDKAFYLANEGRKGPVWIDVPLDIQNMRIDPDALPRDHSKQGSGQSITEEVLRTASDLKEAKRPLLFIGGGARGTGAYEAIDRIARANGLPVVFSASAADIYGSGNSLSIGAVGSLGGSRAGNFAVQNADYLLVVGSKLSSLTTGSEPEKFAREAKITVVDIDESEHTKAGVRIDRVIMADARNFLEELAGIDLTIDCAAWTRKCLHWKEIFSVSRENFVQTQNRIDLYRFADTLSGLLSDEATVITDAGLEELIVPSAIRYRNGQKCLFPASQGAMGYAIPAVIGAHFAGRKDIVTIVGDGSFMMNMQELMAIAWHRIPARIFVMNNNMYAVIRKRQRDLFRTRTIGNDPSDGLGAPDFKKIAAAFSIPYRRIEALQDLRAGIQEVLRMDTVCLCEVMCTEEQPYLHTSFAFTEKRRLVKRSLEDLSPFLEREIFRNEMIVAPIEE